MKAMDEIRGDLNTFKKICSSVNFAVEVMENHKQITSQANEIERGLVDKKAELEKLAKDIADGKEEYRKLVQQTGIQRQSSQEIADKILADAKIAATALVRKANDDVAELTDHAQELRDEIAGLNTTLTGLSDQQLSAKKELDKLTNAMESALSRVKTG